MAEEGEGEEEEEEGGDEVAEVKLPWEFSV